MQVNLKRDLMQVFTSCFSAKTTSRELEVSATSVIEAPQNGADRPLYEKVEVSETDVIDATNSSDPPILEKQINKKVLIVTFEVLLYSHWFVIAQWCQTVTREW